MPKGILLLLALLLGLGGAARAGAEEERFVPSWISADPAAQTVTMRFVAAYNGNNGGWNFNGYYDGSLNLVVPAGWRVIIEFETRDAQVPHSLVVTKPYAEDEFPEKAGAAEAAIRRAFAKSPDRGMRPPGNDRVRFKAGEPAKYYFFCGVVSHGRTGMWLRFEVSGDAAAPYAVLDPSRIDPSAQPGWR
jgi:hypothetical protein